ncbi:MAG TPA: MraY family glycosyltransferase [Saprospiraceae bacterium]|jgi:UDP-N-acetylmuramyl pentapeptide phosphotransferase/UDP-N-acetylglucosamine-1-phosphate transferase|nr:MraY family glycosyltransferase [Saprospiraceae bacterium]
MHLPAISFITAFALTYFAIPPIIEIARTKHLFDIPGERSSHKVATPSLGGVAIFAGAVFSIVLWTPFKDFANLQYILGAFLILFLIGVKDDISPVSPGKKMIAQLLAAAILIFRSDIRLEGMYGLLGFHDELGGLVFILLSFFTIIVIVNAFNLLDGIDGLAGSVGAIIMVTFGVWFYLTGHVELSTVAFASAGAVAAFLRFNYSPARIFMGDTGSLFIGLVCTIMSIRFINFNYALDDGHPYKFAGTPAVAIGIMMLPLFDTLRVFITRIFRGHSPFHPDRRHIHHMLIDFGMTHLQATALLVFVQMLFTVLAFSFHYSLGLHRLLLLEIILAIGMTYWLHLNIVKHRRFRLPE